MYRSRHNVVPLAAACLRGCSPVACSRARTIRAGSFLGCRPQDALFGLLKKSFDAAYDGNRAPFPLFVHAPWFTFVSWVHVLWGWCGWDWFISEFGSVELVHFCELVHLEFEQGGSRGQVGGGGSGSSRRQRSTPWRGRERQWWCARWAAACRTGGGDGGGRAGGARSPTPVCLAHPLSPPSPPSQDNTKAAIQFVEYANSKPDVWFVTMSQLMDWMKNPGEGQAAGAGCGCQSGAAATQ